MTDEQMRRSVVEPLYKSVLSFIGAVPIQVRAKSVGITLSSLLPREFPPDLREDYTSIRERLGLMGTVAPALSDEEAQEVAEDLFSLFLKVNGGLFGGR